MMLTGTVTVVLIKPLPAPPWLVSTTTRTLCDAAVVAAARTATADLETML